jgi:L-alanine-DL-glutamate epimerase-like enolase superfamily enzyme
VATSTPGVPYLEMPPGHLATPLLAESIRFGGGAVAVRDRAGLGADPDPDVLSRYAYARGARAPSTSREGAHLRLRRADMGA